MSKAIVLPINVLVIVTVATIASLGLVGVYGVGYNPFSSAMGVEGAKNVACRQLTFGGCKAGTNTIQVKYDSNKDGNVNANDNLFELCKNFLGRPDEKSCKQICGCVGTSISGGSSTSDFSVSVSPSSSSITLGSSATPTVNVGGVSTAAVTLSITGCPAGATCQFSQNTRVPSFSPTLTITNAPLGAHTMTVTGTNGTTMHSAAYSLNVNPVGGFTFNVAITPSTDTATQGTPFGRTAAVTVTRTSAPGTEKQVDAVASGSITGGMVLLGFASCTPNPTCSGSLTLSTTAATPAGTYTITVTGTSGATTSSGTYTITVNPFVGPCTCNWNMEYACGISPTTHAECRISMFWLGWWKKCQCNIPGCGHANGITCGGFPEDTEVCRNVIGLDPSCDV
jgi:hypothetical protein